MTREETIKLLSILKAAYPNSYRGMTKEEANGTIMVWATQFADIPANVVMIAVNKIISANPFPPAISEVRKKIRDLYYEAQTMLREHEYATEGFKISNDPNDEPMRIGTPLDAQTLATVNEIISVTSPMRGQHSDETELKDILKSGGGYLLPSAGKGEH